MKIVAPHSGTAMLMLYLCIGFERRAPPPSSTRWEESFPKIPRLGSMPLESAFEALRMSIRKKPLRYSRTIKIK